MFDLTSSWAHPYLLLSEFMFKVLLKGMRFTRLQLFPKSNGWIKFSSVCLFSWAGHGMFVFLVLAARFTCNYWLALSYVSVVISCLTYMLFTGKGAFIPRTYIISVTVDPSSYISFRNNFRCILSEYNVDTISGWKQD